MFFYCIRFRLSNCRYVLWRLVCDGRKSLVYEYPKGLGEYFPMAFGTGITEICISDGCEPIFGGCMTLLISGSGPTKNSRPVYDVFKNNAASLYMPPPSESEILQLAKHCFPEQVKDDASVEALHARIKHWGPVPRLVLGRVENQEEDAELSMAIASQNVSALRRLVRTMNDLVVVNDISFRTVHYKINPTYTGVTFTWASEEIGRRVVALLQRELQEDRYQLLADMLAHKHLLALSQPLWEAWCNIQMAGVEGRGPLGFRIRRLGVGSASCVGKGKPHLDTVQLFKDADALLGVSIDGDGFGTLQIPRATSTVQLSAGSAATLPAATGFGGRRFRAKACFAVADFIESSGVCSNATVEPVHSLVLVGKDPANGLLSILQRLHPTTIWGTQSGAAVPFLWLVPPIIFEECRAGLMVIERQSELKLDASIEAKAAHEQEAALREAARHLSPWVVQYAVEVVPPDTEIPMPPP